MLPPRPIATIVLLLHCNHISATALKENTEDNCKFLPYGKKNCLYESLDFYNLDL